VAMRVRDRKMLRSILTPWRDRQIVLGGWSVKRLISGVPPTP